MATIRPLIESDVPEIVRIIRDVREEHGLSDRLGDVLEASDRTLLETYRPQRSEFFVARVGGAIAGGAGIAPLAGADAQTCELQRMYLDARYRSRGIGKALLDRCVEAAAALGYSSCYAETIREMTKAIALYESRGFRRLDAPLGDTGHRHNDCWLYLDLSN
jgi:putative acetyltransferase